MKGMLKSIGMRNKRGNTGRIASGVLILASLGFALASRRVEPSPHIDAKVQESEPYKISDNVRLVVLDVSVKDARGGYVSGLEKKDFQVFDNGHPRTITQFGNEDTPVTIGLVVDDSGSMVRKRQEVVVAGLAFAKESNPKDEFFVVNFNNFVVPGLPAGTEFTDDLQTIRKALYYGRPIGQTALYDAVAYSLKHLEKSSQEKRTLIVVSDGGDNVSKTSNAELMKMVESSRATIYTIGLFDPDERDGNPSSLRNLAKVTGGEFFEPKTLEDVIPVFHRIAKDIRNRYTVAYVPDYEHDRHQIRSVRVFAQNDGHRKLIVKARTNYSTAEISDLLAQGSRNSPQDASK